MLCMLTGRYDKCTDTANVEWRSIINQRKRELVCKKLSKEKLGLYIFQQGKNDSIAFQISMELPIYRNIEVKIHFGQVKFSHALSYKYNIAFQMTYASSFPKAPSFDFPSSCKNDFSFIDPLLNLNRIPLQKLVCSKKQQLIPYIIKNIKGCSLT